MLSQALQAHIFMPRSSIQIGNDLYLSFRTIRDVCDFNFGLPSHHGGGVLLFIPCVVCGFHTNILRISGSHELISLYKNALSESFTLDYNHLLSYALQIRAFQ
jgi:hypothetical protein